MRRIPVFIGCLILIVGLNACNRFKQVPSNQQTSGNVRIVCVSKQLTELIFALGAGDKLVGVDLSSTYPPEATKLPTVGYHRLLSAEGITSLHPTVVFHDGNIAPEAVMKQVAEVGIPIREFKGSNTIQETEQLMRTLGKEFNAEGRADSLCRKLETDMDAVEQRRAQFVSKPRVMIIHFGRVINNYLVMGQRGTATKILEWAGAQNAVDFDQGMKPLSAELVASANPDVILLTDFGYDRFGGVENVKSQLAGIALTAAARNNKIYRVEEHDLVYLGPRTGEIVQNMMELIHR